MVVQLTNEQEAQLSRISSQAGRSVEDLAREAVDRYLAEDAHFREAAQEGIDAAERGDLLSSEEVWARVERALQA